MKLRDVAVAGANADVASDGHRCEWDTLGGKGGGGAARVVARAVASGLHLSAGNGGARHRGQESHTRLGDLEPQIGSEILVRHDLPFLEVDKRCLLEVEES